MQARLMQTFKEAEGPPSKSLSLPNLLREEKKEATKVNVVCCRCSDAILHLINIQFEVLSSSLREEHSC